MKPAIPPALVAVLCGLAMWGLDRVYRPEWITFDVSIWMYGLLFGLGAVIIVLALFQFRKHRTTVDPHDLQKATSLVRGGIYGFSRNPMYLAMLFWLAAFGFKLGNILVFLLLPVFVWYMNAFQIRPEEGVMKKKFGSAYAEYKEQVRRWL